MIARGTLFGFLITLMAGVGAYTITVQTRPASPTTAPVASADETLLTWLGASEAQKAELRSHDPSFASDLSQLRTTLNTKKRELATLLEKGDASDEAIRAQLETVLNASNAIERRVTTYLLAVRDHLTPEQRRRFFGLCAEQVREGYRCQCERFRRGMTGSQPGEGGGRQWGRMGRETSTSQPCEGGGPGRGHRGGGAGSRRGP